MEQINNMKDDIVDRDISGDQHYKMLIDNMLHDCKKFPFLGHNFVRSAPITEERNDRMDKSIPIGAYAFLLDELGSWEAIYRKLFAKFQDDSYENLDENISILKINPTMIEAQTDEELEIGISKYGGYPDLPDSIEWPLGIDSKPATFLAQINLHDLRFYHSPKSVLPEKGMLFFFRGSDNPNHSQDMKQAFSFYWNGSTSELKRRVNIESEFETPNILIFDENSEQLEIKYPDQLYYFSAPLQLFGHSIFVTYPRTCMLFYSPNDGTICFLESEIEKRKRKGIKSLISRYEKRGNSDYVPPNDISILTQEGSDNNGQHNMFSSFDSTALIFKRYSSVFQSRVTDWDMNSFLPPFVENYKPITKLENPKFWRRKDILIPGQEINPPKDLITTSFVKDDPTTRSTDESLPDTLINKDKCFKITSILDPYECAALRVSSLPFYTNIQSEYPKEYRNCERALLKSQKLADLLWERIRPFLNEEDFKNVQPYGFDNNGVWLPMEINPCFRLSAYKPGTYFKPHKDAQFVRNDNEKSIFTVLLYLNGVYQGGSTTLLEKIRDESLDGSEMTFRVLHEERPEQGAVMIFNHDLYHQGSVVNYEKVVLRSEIIFKRVDALSVPRSDYRNSEEYLKVKKLIEESNELEKKGDTKQSLLKYLNALDVQTNLSSSLQWSDLSNKSQLERLPEEIIGIICSFLTSREIATLLLPISSIINSNSRSPAIWKEKFNQEWCDSSNNETEEEEDEHQDDDIIVFHEAKSVKCRRNEIIFNQVSKNYKDWYALFISRKYMDLFWSPVLLDPGTASYRFSLQNSDTAEKDIMICCKPNHPHFNLPGFGLDDILTGRRATDTSNSYLTAPLPMVDSCGRIEDYFNFKTFLFQLYEYDLNVKFQTHPLVLAVPFSWTESDISKVKKMINELGIQLSYLVDSSKLIAYNYSKSNCVLLNISTSGIGCVPIRDFEPINKLRVFEPFNVTNLPHSIRCEDNIYGALRLALAVPPTPLQLFEEMKEKWEGFTYENNLSIQVGYNHHTFDAETILDIGDQLFITAFEILKEMIESLKNNNELIEDVLICGGFSSLNGMKERLSRELREIYPNLNLEFKSDDMEVIGGAKILCTLPKFKEQLQSTLKH